MAPLSAKNRIFATFSPPLYKNWGAAGTRYPYPVIYFGGALSLQQKNSAQLSPVSSLQGSDVARKAILRFFESLMSICSKTGISISFKILAFTVGGTVCRMREFD